MVFRANCLPGNLHLTGYVVVCYNSQMDRLKDVANAIEWVTDFEGERVAFPAEWKGPEPERSPPDLLPLILISENV